MARGFGVTHGLSATTDLITYANSAAVDVSAGVTFSVWCYPTAFVLNHAFHLLPSGDATNAIGLQLPNHATGYIGAFASGTDGTLASNFGVELLTADTWQHVWATYSGGTNGTDWRFWINNVENTYHDATNAATTRRTTIGSWIIGGRKFDTARQYFGKLSRVGVWTGVLGDKDRLKASLGYPVEEIAPDFLVWAPPLLGDRFISTRGYWPTTLTGTRAHQDPRQLIVWRRRKRYGEPAAAAGLVGPLTKGGPLRHGSLIRGGRLAA